MTSKESAKAKKDREIKAINLEDPENQRYLEAKIRAGNATFNARDLWNKVNTLQRARQPMEALALASWALRYMAKRELPSDAERSEHEAAAGIFYEDGVLDDLQAHERAYVHKARQDYENGSKGGRPRKTGAEKKEKKAEKKQAVKREPELINEKPEFPDMGELEY